MHIVLEEQLQRRVCAYLDLRSLLRMRRCSRHYLDLVNAELYESLLDMVACFVPHPDRLLTILVDRDSYVGGQVAQQYLLREPVDTEDPAARLDIYVPSEQFDAILNHLERRQGATEVAFPGPPTVDLDEWLEEHALLEVAAFLTTQGVIYVHRAEGEDALAPVARSWSTLHMCYANGILLGCGFPGLLFERRGLIGDMSTEEEDIELCDDYLARGFDLRLTASSWEEFGGQGGGVTCCADHWCCHAQPRRFDDAGALRCKMWLDIERLDESYVAATWVTWRLDVRPCGGDCLAEGDLESNQLIQIEP